VALPVHEFGCLLLGCTANGFSTVIVIYIKFALAEVSQFNLAVGGNEHIFRLEVSVDDVEPVQVANHDHHLRDVEHGHIFIQPLVFSACNVEKQLASWALVHHEADLLRGDEAVVQCHDELVPHLLEQPPFVARAFNLLHALDCLLLECLECEQFVTHFVDYQIHTRL